LEASAYEIIENTLLGYLDSMERDIRIERIDDLLHRLNFERRLSGLTDNQLDHMHNNTLSQPQRAKLEQCKTDRERDELLNEYARVQYFRQCMWVDYLNGTAIDPPILGKPPAHE
jgi:hypothetical protein